MNISTFAHFRMHCNTTIGNIPSASLGFQLKLVRRHVPPFHNSTIRFGEYHFNVIAILFAAIGVLCFMLRITNIIYSTQSRMREIIYFLAFLQQNHAIFLVLLKSLLFDFVLVLNKYNIAPWHSFQFRFQIENRANTNAPLCFVNNLCQCL